ncbi:DMT family transporter [Streptomyces sp. NPDC048277]|uniref:DMT family transporter n=1 Tax=Streptomyces sp. NPDC048277 TaxID=3155027 RepID=UPI00340329A5
MRTKLDAVSGAAVLITVLAFSATAPLTAYAAAPAFALAFGRNALGLLTLGPAFLLVRRREVRRVFSGERGLVRRQQRRAVLFGLAAGTALAVHFATFMTGAQMTSVAMATALVATQPVWQALIATAQGRRLSRTAWAGLAISVAGAMVASGADTGKGANAVAGDGLALAGAIALAAYTALSEEARPDVSTPMYSVLCFSVCTVEMLLLCLVTGTPPVSFTAHAWLALLGLLLLPQLLGLFSLNFALGRAPATAVSVLLLLEAPVAASVAWLWLGQLPAASAWPGLVMIMLGVAVVVIGDARRAPSVQDLPGHDRSSLHTLLQHPILATAPPPGEDVYERIWRDARLGRPAEAENTIRQLENHAVRLHGAKSAEATRWIEVRAHVAHLSGDGSLAVQLWLSAARFHAEPPRTDITRTRLCLERAFTEWRHLPDHTAMCDLGRVLREMYTRHPSDPRDHHRWSGSAREIDAHLAARGFGPVAPE